MKAVDTILVSVGPRSRLHLLAADVHSGQDLDGRIVAKSDFPPWPTTPDFIVEASTRLWTGVVWAVPRHALPIARVITEQCNASLVRLYDSHREAPAFCRTEAFNEEGDAERGVLELRWSPYIEGEHELASLAEDRWLYGQGTEALVSLYGRTERYSLLGFGVSSVDEVAAAFGVTLPSSDQYLV